MDIPSLEGFAHLFRLVFAHHAVVHEHAGELRSDGFCQQRRADGRIHAAGQRQQHLAVSDLRADGFHGLFTIVLHVPVAAAAADLEQEIAEDGLAVLRMLHFRVELHAEEFTGDVFHGRDRAHARACHAFESLRKLHDGIRVAHPADAFFGHAFEQDAAAVGHGHFAVFGEVAGGTDLSFRHPRQQLVTVTDAQDGDAGVQQRRVVMGRCGVVHGVGTAGKDDPLIPFRLDFFDCNFVIGLQFRVDAQIAHSAGNQLIVLAAEVQH